jgi:ABC-type transport system involved in multi-copper enzyme maturation permease subunit
MISWPVARATFRERGRSALTLVLAAMLAVSALRSTPEQAFQGFGQALLIVFTLLVGAGLLADEIESGHAQLVLLRPLTRADWYGGRFAGAALVLLGGLALAFACSAFWAITHGSFSAAQLLVLPVAFLWSAAWLSVVVAVGAAARSWTNAGIVVASGIGWLMLLGLIKFVSTVWFDRLVLAGKYLGPQQPLPLSLYEPVAYDLLWLVGAWLAGVLVLNRRELAKRRT